MSLNSARRRQLLARSHELKAHIHVGRDGVTTGAVDLVRQALATSDLVKVRLSADDREGLDRLINELVEQVPCQLVKRVGFVAILFRGDADAAGPANIDEDADD